MHFCGVVAVQARIQTCVNASRLGASRTLAEARLVCLLARAQPLHPCSTYPDPLVLLSSFKMEIDMEQVRETTLNVISKVVKEGKLEYVTVTACHDPQPLHAA